MKQSIVLLVDYANARSHLPNLSELVAKLSEQLLPRNPIAKHDVLLRFYGGWYERQVPTSEREEAVKFVDSARRLMSTGSGRIRARYEIADDLLYLRSPVDAQSVPIYSSFVRRTPKPNFKRQNYGQCDASKCELEALQRWMQNNSACTFGGCQNKKGDLFEQPEQKQVDSHLLTDLLQVTHNEAPNFLGVFSSDSDMIPGLLAAANQLYSSEGTLVHIRKSGRQTYADRALREFGAEIVEV